MNGALVLSNLTVSLHGTAIVHLDTTIERGEVLTLMAPSGAGKSTALAAIIGTLPAAFTMSGRVILNDREVTHLPTRNRRIGILFQDDVLFPHLSVGGNLAFALPSDVRPRSERSARIEAALAAAGLDGFADRDPATLSGGQRARVSMLRTLLAEPCALLLDEPFSRLDTDLRGQIRSFVLNRARELGLPMVLVTHDHDDAKAAGGRVISPLGLPLTGAL